jgi:glucose-6-phosphate 1-dehydrogenase
MNASQNDTKDPSESPLKSSLNTGPQEPGQQDAYFCPMPSAPCAIVIFGASGDLYKRKLLPALRDLSAHSCLAPRFRLVGFGRTPMTDDAFRSLSEDAVRSTNGANPSRKQLADEFFSHFYYCQGEYDDADSYRRLGELLTRLNSEGKLGGNRLFYLATPPSVYPRVIEQLGQAKLAKPRGSDSFVRIILEKPFGRDLASAQNLNRQVLSVFDESQVYRIDHYLGKETVQNLLVFRFGNGIFEPLWNRNYISHVQITAAETLGVERRAAFYESAGALRDMIQSHVLQLLSLTAMESPAMFDATDLRNEKLKVLQSIRPLTEEEVAHNVVGGQYAAGSIAGKPVSGYRQEPGVAPDSSTETYAALKLEIDNWRWAGVPFFLRTGKRMARSFTEVAVQFREAPHRVFRGQESRPNWLVLNIQPDEGISLSFGAKAPGAELDIREVKMDFSYSTSFGARSQDAYATLINDCLNGVATLFDRADGVEAAWSLLEPAVRKWSAPSRSIAMYPAGSWGPTEADALLQRYGFAWRRPQAPSTESLAKSVAASEAPAKISESGHP